MSITTYFLRRNKKNIMRIPAIIWSYVEYQAHLALAKAGLKSGVVLFLSGLYSGILLYLW